MLLAHLLLRLARICRKALRLHRIDQAVASKAAELNLPAHKVEGRLN
jgi:hypothetical protein